MSSSDAKADLVLREGLRENPLSPAAMERIRAAVEPVWRANAARPRMRWMSYASLAACLALVLMVGMLTWRRGAPEGHGALAAHLRRFDLPGVVEARGFHRSRGLAEGAVLRAGHTYRADGKALFALEGGGNMRLAAGSEFEVIARDVVRLQHGELYVDISPGSRPTLPFIARTSAGEFRHVGTQFSLAVAQGRTRLRVREGRVHWLVANGESTVEAGTEVTFIDGLQSAERSISPSSVEWDLVASSTPDFEIEDRPLAEFLSWVARESGRKLVMADDQAREKVATIKMHGSVHGLTPMQALAAVMAATELRYDLFDGQIRVSFAGTTTPRS
jgi:ferric-dicitrate binding protein FerR (iron transport regulator)